MSRPFTLPLSLTAVAATGIVALVVVAASGGAPRGAGDRGSSTVQRQKAAATLVPAAAGGADAQLTHDLQQVSNVPHDWSAWAALGLDYVQRAKATADPTYYPKAEQSLHHSLQLNSSDNIIGFAGEAALASARHEFGTALRWARRGLAVDPQSAVLHGALADALTQLGRYDEARVAAVAMENLQPGTSAETRLSYAAELRGDTAGAARLMQIAQSNATGSADVAFTRYYLGELMLADGQARRALQEYTAGLAAVPGDTALLEGRAKARLATGDRAGAVQDFAAVVDRLPQPTYVLEYADLLQSLGRTAEAAQQYSVFRVEERLFAANGVTLDTDATLFAADHGDPAAAVRLGRAALRTRPFLESYDAYGWALHRAGNNQAALTMANRALSTGMHSALFRYHRAAIERALGQHAAARHDAAVALQLNPTFNPLLAPDARALAGTR